MPQWPWFCDRRPALNLQPSIVETNSWVVLGRDVEQLNCGIKRLVATCDKWMVLWGGVERLGPSDSGNAAAASGGDKWRVDVTNVDVDLLPLVDSPSGMAVKHLES